MDPEHMQEGRKQQKTGGSFFFVDKATYLVDGSLGDQSEHNGIHTTK